MRGVDGFNREVSAITTLEIEGMRDERRGMSDDGSAYGLRVVG